MLRWIENSIADAFKKINCKSKKKIMQGEEDPALKAADSSENQVIYQNKDFT
jgi:hypothetical protein